MLFSLTNFEENEILFFLTRSTERKTQSMHVAHVFITVCACMYWCVRFLDKPDWLKWLSDQFQVVYFFTTS